MSERRERASAARAQPSTGTAYIHVYTMSKIYPSYKSDGRAIPDFPILWGRGRGQESGPAYPDSGFIEQSIDGPIPRDQ
jgi:hypothetical protein